MYNDILVVVVDDVARKKSDWKKMSFAQMYNAEVIDQEEMLAKTRRFILELRKRCNPLHVYLFGSLSTKNFKLGSDIDLLLILKLPKIFASQESL